MTLIKITFSTQIVMMASAGISFENELLLWLKTVLKNENLEDLSVNISGNSEKGDGYIGDIVFVTASGITENKSAKTLDLVLKCSKNSKALRETAPVKEAFLIEIFVYEILFPYFIQFQKEKGIEDPYNSVPKFYGSYTEENREVIVFENLKSIGYELWPKRDPLSRKHIDLVVTEYGKFHATSLALQLQCPTIIQEFVENVSDVFKKLSENGDLDDLYIKAIDECHELLKNDLDKETLSKWLDLKKKIRFICGGMSDSHFRLEVILHGDCWNNNFMFLHAEDDEKVPLKVAFLDWQIARYNSPVLDLSYFLFTCSSPEDLNKLDDILDTYYQSFVNHLEKLGVESPAFFYPRNQFFDEWKTYSKYGVLMCSFLMKIVSSDKDEVLDIAQVAESGKPFTEGFANEIRDKEHFKKRIRPIVEYAVKHSLI